MPAGNIAHLVLLLGAWFLVSGIWSLIKRPFSPKDDGRKGIK